MLHANQRHASPFASAIAAAAILLQFGALGALAEQPSDPGLAPPPPADLRRAVVENYAAVVHASYAETARRVAALEEAIGAFLAEPGDDALAAAKSAWSHAREAYGQTEAYRFYDGPIDGDHGAPESLINAWPLDEAYLDYTVDDPNAGIVNRVDLYPELTVALLAELNMKDGEENVATGFHAIEFLLWGQDLDPNGPGARSWKDYVPGAGAANAERRGRALRFSAARLAAHMGFLLAEWAPDSGSNYRARFAADPPAASLQKILTGIGMLAGDELAGERMAVAYETGDQEDEHSCFSDTTCADLLANAKGIENVYVGRWGAEIDGPGLDDLIREADPALAEKIDASLKAALEAVGAIPHPFDQALQNGPNSPARAKLLAAVEAMEQLASDLAKGGEALGIAINIEAAEE
jgi:putative iron-regulated protein